MIKFQNGVKKPNRLVYLRIILITVFSLGIFGCGGKPAEKGNSGFPGLVVNLFSIQTR